MGRFSTTVHIKSDIPREQFMDMFCGVIKKRKLVPCAKDKAGISYLLAFSSGWVTIAGSEYKEDIDLAHRDSYKIAAELDTAGFSVSVSDSDCAIIELSVGARKDVDEAIVGDDGYTDSPPRGKRKYWEPLLAQGSTWKQLQEVWSKVGLYVEDLMYESSPLLGINPDYIIAEYDEIAKIAKENSADIVPMYFEKSGKKK